MNKTHWSVWLTIAFTALSMLMGAVVTVTQLNSRIEFVETRIEEIIDLCCSEVHRSMLIRKELKDATKKTRKTSGEATYKKETW